MKKFLKKATKTEKFCLIVFGSLFILGLISSINEVIKEEYWMGVQAFIYTLLLFVPFIIQKLSKLKFGPWLVIALLLYIFGGTTMGTVYNFHRHVPHWDTLFHAITGFIATGFGVTLFVELNKKVKLSPMSLVIGAFCFSMTIGVIWEIYEFGADMVFKTDMQDSWIVNNVASFHLDPDRNRVINIENIDHTILFDRAGNQLAVIQGGYIDTGIIDTMKDLIFHVFGALIFSYIGYVYLKNNKKYRFVEHFIPEKVRNDKKIKK
jgi:hypothetical protein